MDRSPRVRCGGCDFAWFSATSAHGLRVVGSCPRCGGTLTFLRDAAEDRADADERDRVSTRIEPALVLGTPLGRGGGRRSF